jgi:hypothetical protein
MHEDVLDGGLATIAMGIDVVEFEKTRLAAATPGLADEGATTGIALPYHAADRRRDVPRVGHCRPAWTRFVGCGILGFLELRQKHGQRPIEDRGRIAIRNLMP